MLYYLQTKRVTEGKKLTGSLVGGNPKFERFVNYMARMTVKEIDQEIAELDFSTESQAKYERLTALRPFEVAREFAEKQAKKAAHERRMARAVSGFADALVKAGL